MLHRSTPRFSRHPCSAGLSYPSLRATIFACGLLCLSGFHATAGDWPQWRGPGRDGIVTASPPLVDQFARSGPRLLWKSEKILGGGKGGYGSAVIADGKAFVYANAKDQTPIPTRTLTTVGLERLGWSPGMPKDLWQELEEARLSKARSELPREDLFPWVESWIEKNVGPDQQKFRSACFMRLLAGERGVPSEAFVKLAGIRDREFASQEKLNEWYEENGIEDKWRKTIGRVILTTRALATDTIVCVDMSDGRTVWKGQFPGAFSTHSSSSTPCIADGRCYVAGSNANVFCLDAQTGDLIWQSKSKANPKKTFASSFGVLDGVAVLLGGVLSGFDADTGKPLWTRSEVKGEYASGAYWRTNGKTYLVCNGKKQTSCFEPRTGKVLWSVPGGGWSTPAVSEGHMVVFTYDKKIGVVAYKLGAAEPTEVWRVPFRDRGASPVIHDGHVYVIGGRVKARAMCVHLASGKVVWEQKLRSAELASPVLADGKIIFTARTWLHMIRATPEAYTPLGKANLRITSCTSPAFADGKVCLRLRDCVACYDLRK